jgi:Ribbon-helix-helix protein, copG family
MRTTITLDPDVAAAVAKLRKDNGSGVSEVVNDLARRGLAAGRQEQPFVQRTRAMGVPAVPLDDIAAVLESLEGDAHG